MRDPYSVLGVSPSASADEIKKTYRKLSRMYHPDANINNPNKERAEEKFKEVQEAYEQIMDERENGPRAQSSSRGSYGNAYGSSYGSSYGRSSNSSYGNSAGGSYGDPSGGSYGGYYGGSEQRYRSYRYANRGEKLNVKDTDTSEVKGAIAFINSNMYAEALRVLNGVINYARDARWYYVRAHAYYGMGDIFKAQEDARTATGLEPNNREYADYYRMLDKEDDIYRGMGYSYGRKSCNCCSEIICAEFCLVAQCCCIGSKYTGCLC